jgi:hypothetical protein
MNAFQILTAISPIIEVLEQLGVSYHIGDSVASSVYGILRATIDADLVADLRLENVRPLVMQLKTDYYIDEDMIRDAIKRRSSFNVIHLDTMLKVDVFIPKSRLFDQEELRRSQQEVLLEGTRPFSVASPEARFSINSNGTGWAGRCQIGNGTISWAYSKSRELSWTCFISKIGQRT